MIDQEQRAVQLKTFMKYTTSLYDKFKDVQIRLISAFGIDTSNEHTKIEWDHFINIKRFLELFICTQDELEDIWIKVIDSRGLAFVDEDEFVEFFEKLARGCMNEEPTSVSSTFSVTLVKMLDAEGCMVGPEGQR